MLPIISAEERLKERHSAKVGLVGFPGVGKTTQLRTLPPASTLFVDLEAGDLSVKDWPGDTVRPRTWQEFRDLVVFLAGPMPTASADQAFSKAHFEHVCATYGDPAQLAKYDTYFVDSLTVLSRLCLAWCKTQPQAFSEKTGKPDNRGAYGLLGQEMITALTHLQHVRDKHVTQGWTGGYATQSFDTGAVYLACEFVVTDGPFAKRKMWSNVGLYSPKGPTWGQMGRSFIRAVLNSARNVQPQDNSPQAAAARRINSFADLDGIEFLARVDVEKDGKGEDRNVVKVAIEPDHKDYVPLTGMHVPGGSHRGGGGHSGAPVQPTPAYAQQAPQAQTSRPVVPTGKPAWAQ